MLNKTAGLLRYVLMLVMVASSTKAADTSALREGQLDGVDFQISVPANWNGALVMFAHGYEGEGPASGNVVTSPMDSHLTHNGYAWAASGYRAKGYRPDWFLADTLALREHFAREVGPPRWTMIHGQSMGGHVATAAMEQHPGVFQGALVECGIVEGVGLVDWLYAYTAAAEYLSGVPLLDTPRPAFSTLVNATWLPLMGTPGSYTERGQRFDSVVKHLAGGDVALRLQGLQRRYVLNLNPSDPGVLGAREFARHADTRQIRYEVDPGLGVDVATLNREVRRAVPASGARSREVNPIFAESTGKITAPMMTIHETADFRVPFRLQQDYRRRADAAGSGKLLVQRIVAGAGHCGFDGRVRERGFDELVAWMERGTVPPGDDVLGDVAKLGGRWRP